MSDLKTINSKKMLKDLANSKTKIKFNDRIKLTVIADTRFYHKDQEINPHRVFGLELVKLNIAKEVK